MKTLSLFLFFVSGLVAAEPAVRLGTAAMLANEVALAVVFSPESTAVGIVEPDGIRFWDLATAKELPGRAITKLNTSYARVAGDGSGVTAFDMVNEKPHLWRYDLVTQQSSKLNADFGAQTILFAENGRYGVNARSDTWQVWNTRTLEKEHVFDVPRDLRRFSASDDGRAFAFCDRDGGVSIRRVGGARWRADTGIAYAAVALSADATRLATTSFREDNSGKKHAGPIRITNLDDGSIVTCTASEWFAEFPNRLRFTPDGSTLLAADGAYLRGWNTKTGALVFAVEPGWNFPGSIVVSPDSRHVAVAYARRAMVWDLKTGQPPRGFEAHTGPVWSMTFSNDGSKVATTSYGLPQVMVWDTRSGELKHELDARFGSNTPTNISKPQLDPKAHHGIPGRVRVAFHHELIGTMNEATGAPGPLRVWETGNTLRPRLAWSVPIADSFAPEFAFTKHGVFVAHTKPALHDMASGGVKWTSPAAITALAVKTSRDGTLTVIEEKNGTQNPVIDTATGKVLSHFDGVPLGFRGHDPLVLRPGPTHTGGVFKDIIARGEQPIGSTAMGEALGKLSDDGEIRVLAHSTDTNSSGRKAFEFREVAGDRVLSTAPRVDIIPTGDPWADAFVAVHQPVAMTFSRDARLFAAAYASGALGVWDVATGEVLLSERSPCLNPKFLTFSPDGRHIFTASGDGAGGPAYGYDTTGIGSVPLLRGTSASARRAVENLAADKPKAIAEANAILEAPTAKLLEQGARWLDQLASESFAEREEATKALADAGWRLENLMEKRLNVTENAEVRERLAALLMFRDFRPQRAVHVLELVGAKAELKTLADQQPESFITRDAKRALERLPE